MRFTRSSLAFASGALLVALSACSGGGGGGGYFPGGGGGGYTPTPTNAPTTSPTAVPTACSTGTPAPATGAAVFYLNTSCTTANTKFGYTIPGDANGTLVAASTVDESEPLAANAVQTAPPADTIAVSLTAGETTALARRAPARPNGSAVRRSASNVSFQRRFVHARPIANRKLASLLLSATRGSAATQRKRSILPTTLGSTANIWTLATSSSGTSYIQVASTLEYTSQHGDIWVDNTLLSTNGGPLATTAIATIGTDYDNAWAADTANVGSPDWTANSPDAGDLTNCTGSGTPIFIPDPDDRQAVFVISSASNGGFGSYFDPANLIYNNVATNCLQAESNERSGVYLQYTLGNANDTQTQQLAEDDVVLPANDLTHLIDFVGHTITNAGTDGENNQTFLQTGYIDTPFILEGLASLSEDFAATRMYPSQTIDVDDNGQSAQTYLAAPENYELTAFYGTDPASTASAGCTGCFGSAYLFARYAYDRFGASYPGAIVTSGLTGFSNLQNAFGATTSPENVIGDFAVAMLASGQSVTTDPRFNVTGFTTYGTYTDQSGGTLTLTGPASVATQSVPSDTNYATHLGAFVYLTLGGLPASATAQVTDGSGGFGLAAALDQH